MSTAVIPADAGAPARAARPSGRGRFYAAMAPLLAAMVVAGFWPTYFGPLTAGSYTGSWVFHVHGAVFMGWMGLFILQAALVPAGHTRLHRRLGTAGIVYGGVLLAVGLAVSFYAPVVHIRSGAWDLDAAASFLLLPLGDMALFGGLFGAAIRYRRQPEVHKRLMLLATIAIVFAAVFRRIPPDRPGTFLAVWLAPLAAAMIYDWRTRGRVHRVYLVGLVILVAAFARIFVRESELWLTIGRALLAPVV